MGDGRQRNVKLFTLKSKTNVVLLFPSRIILIFSTYKYNKKIIKYSKASRYTASSYTDFTDTRFLIGSRKIRATLILSLFFTDTRFFRFSKLFPKIVFRYFYNYLELSNKVSFISLPQLLTDLEICHIAFLYIFFSNTCVIVHCFLHTYHKKGTSLYTDLAHL